MSGLPIVSIAVPFVGYLMDTLGREVAESHPADQTPTSRRSVVLFRFGDVGIG